MFSDLGIILLPDMLIRWYDLLPLAESNRPDLTLLTSWRGCPSQNGQRFVCWFPICWIFNQNHADTRRNIMLYCVWVFFAITTSRCFLKVLVLSSYRHAVYAWFFLHILTAGLHIPFERQVLSPYHPTLVGSNHQNKSNVYACVCQLLIKISHLFIA